MNRNVKFFIAGAGLALLIPFGWKQWSSIDSYKCDKTPIQAEAGDDYWGYLQEHCTGNLENAAKDVVGFYGPTLMPGRVIYLPSSDECELSWVKMANGSEYVYESCPK